MNLLSQSRSAVHKSLFLSNSYLTYTKAPWSVCLCATDFNWLLRVKGFKGRKTTEQETARVRGCSMQFSFQSRGSTFHPLKRSSAKHCPLSPALSRPPSPTVCSLPRLCLFLLSLRVLLALSFGRHFLLSFSPAVPSQSFFSFTLKPANTVTPFNWNKLCRSTPDRASSKPP